jgi:glycosyltransferase involved in cell wall biosynthesis
VNELISVIVATYNREAALDAVLRALSQQTDRHFEIIVADDGSEGPTRALVQTWAERSEITIRHVWQEDRGFRAG